jgi:hypothetical protein
MKKPVKGSFLFFVVILFTGCTYYQAASGVYSTSPPSKFDRSFAAVVGAFKDQGLHITTEDRSAGQVDGNRNGIDVRATLQTQADGSVRVAFNTAGTIGNDPELIDRITRSYNRRMGR